MVVSPVVIVSRGHGCCLSREREAWVVIVTALAHFIFQGYKTGFSIIVLLNVFGLILLWNEFDFLGFILLLNVLIFWVSLCLLDVLKFLVFN